MLLGRVLWLASVTSASAFYPVVPVPSPIPVAPFAQTQTTSISSLVPSDLSSGFIPDSIQLKVSYNGTTSDEFKDGALFSMRETDKQPLFAFGDASGVNTALAYAILMVDTTSASQRTLHFLQTDFKASGDRTDMNSSAKPAFPYHPPLTMGETGRRQYTFLLFQQTPTTGFTVKDVPTDGKNFDVAKWRAANGLEEAQAGITMNVDRNSTSENGNTQAPLLPTASTTASRPSTNAAPLALCISTVFTWCSTGLACLFFLR